MAIPFALIAAAIAAGSQIGGELLDRPRRTRLPIETLSRYARNAALGDVNAATSNFGTQLGPNLASRGLQSTGIGPSMMSRYSGDLTGRALGDVARYRQGLLTQQDELDRTYEQEKAGRWPRLLEIIAQLAGSTAGGLEAGQQNKDLMAMLQSQSGGEDELLRRLFERLYGGGGGRSQMPTMRPGGGYPQGGFWPVME